MIFPMGNIALLSQVFLPSSPYRITPAKPVSPIAHRFWQWYEVKQPAIHPNQ
ncbi:hypothetical protein IQ268_21125 [Oculatella sp. LEGE 06141]|uniref:hypothetical protein n=1 Tax=Oculatella sp. LEGE 06141 TaxID=1828648 RepID=UPI001882FBA1|nr:hypothetical protein [Oculatella sp. LEGE 06141]MBE9181066.1 hypothetical protein [Oculatella sp. LEGE 06141]